MSNENRKGGEMPIRWKVLTHGRHSSYAEGKFRLEYFKGKVVKAEPETLGIMVFDTFKNANLFIHNNTLAYKIIKVRPIGRGKKEPTICSCISEGAINYFYTSKYRGCSPPPGTICYPAVEVLE